MVKQEAKPQVIEKRLLAGPNLRIIVMQKSDEVRVEKINLLNNEKIIILVDKYGTLHVYSITKDKVSNIITVHLSIQGAKSWAEKILSMNTHEDLDKLLAAAADLAKEAEAWAAEKFNKIVDKLIHVDRIMQRIYKLNELDSDIRIRELAEEFIEKHLDI